MVGWDELDSGWIVGTYGDGTKWSRRKSERRAREASETFGTVCRLVAIIPQPRTHQFLYHGVFAKERVRSPDSNRNPRKEVQSEAWCQVSKADIAEVSKSTRKAKMEEAVEEGWEQ